MTKKVEHKVSWTILSKYKITINKLQTKYYEIDDFCLV